MLQPTAPRWRGKTLISSDQTNWNMSNLHTEPQISIIISVVFKEETKVHHFLLLFANLSAKTHSFEWQPYVMSQRALSNLCQVRDHTPSQTLAL